MIWINSWYISFCTDTVSVCMFCPSYIMSDKTMALKEWFFIPIDIDCQKLLISRPFLNFQTTGVKLSSPEQVHNPTTQCPMKMQPSQQQFDPWVFWITSEISFHDTSLYAYAMHTMVWLFRQWLIWWPLTTNCHIKFEVPLSWYIQFQFRC